jgi:cytochrome d ubiquinol oxidase subunit I
MFSLLAYIVVYAVIYSFGLYYIYRLLRDGPAEGAARAAGVTPGRPLALALQGGEE